jgi:Delta3,5-Delta2,4-dienoyl-CoA isomerase
MCAHKRTQSTGIPEHLQPRVLPFPSSLTTDNSAKPPASSNKQPLIPMSVPSSSPPEEKPSRPVLIVPLPSFRANRQVNKETTSSYMSPSKSDPARTANQLKETVKFAQSGTDAVAACSKPIICVLHGIAIGFAIDISSACDIRIAAKDTRLSIKEVDIGLAADCGTLQRFPRVVGNDSWTRELAFSGRFFNAKEALERGFVSYVVEDREKGVTKAMDIARLVVGKSPVAVQGTKVLLDYSRDHSVREALEYTQLWNSIYLQTDVSDIWFHRANL